MYMIQAIYVTVEQLLKRGVDAIISACLSVCGIPDGGWVGWLIRTIAGFLGADLSSLPLPVAICLEYARRSGSLTKGAFLKNRCSVCRCKGHNKRNHPSDMGDFLNAYNLKGEVENAETIFEGCGFLA